MRLAGKVCVVTGASKGIGRAIARRFVAAGAKVAIGARGRDALDVAAKELAEGGADVLARPVDVAVAASVQAFADAVLAHFGRVDVLVCNAGVAARASVVETSEKQWDEVLDTNLKGTFLVTRALLPAIEVACGRIVIVSSIAGRQGTARSSAYCAAKHGVIGFARALAEEVRPVGVLVATICPGSVDTDMLPPEFRPGMPAERVAGVAAFLAADAPLELTGSVLDLFG